MAPFKDEMKTQEMMIQGLCPSYAQFNYILEVHVLSRQTSHSADNFLSSSVRDLLDRGSQVE